MNSNTRAKNLALSGLGALLFVLVAVLLGLTWPASAAPQALFDAYLPVITSPLVAVDVYEVEFEDNIEPWRAVRWQGARTNYDVGHNSGCDSSHCGFLDVSVANAETYMIVSPLILGPNPPYDIEFRAKLRDREDKDQYGVVFGGDWQGQPCPGGNVDGCFNHYYEFRARYRDVSGEKYVEYRLRKIDGHDSNNVEQGTDLIEWTRAEGVDAEDWIKWTLHYGSSGHITVKANNLEQAGSARDTKYRDSRFFGVLSRAGDKSDSKARFDKFSITRED